MFDSGSPKLSVPERELLSFSTNAERGASYVYARSSAAKPIRLMELARQCYERGLIELVQRRDADGIAYVAVKRSPKN
jgi:hypothetical protein